MTRRVTHMRCAATPLCPRATPPRRSIHNSTSDEVFGHRPAARSGPVIGSLSSPARCTAGDESPAKRVSCHRGQRPDCSAISERQVREASAKIAAGKSVCGETCQIGVRGVDRDRAIRKPENREIAAGTIPDCLPTHVERRLAGAHYNGSRPNACQTRRCPPAKSSARSM